MDANFRNFKDFVQLYNKVTEICFSRCVTTMFERTLDKEEGACLDSCLLKFAAFNHEMMKVYVEVQTEINQRRVQELEEAQKLKFQQQQQQQQTPKVQEPISTTSLPKQQSSGKERQAYA